MARPGLMTVLVLLMPLAADAQSFDRFFFTPAERAQLDTTRAQKEEKPVPARASEAPRAPTPSPQTVTFSGVVRRSDGRAMVWLNGRLADEEEALGGLDLRGHVRGDGSISLQSHDGRAAVRVKVGQSVEVHTSKVAERSQPKSHRVHSSDSREERAGSASQNDR
jgi:hypothetical protein